MSINVVLVSHGEFAQGLHNALKMFLGDRDDVYSIGLMDGEDQASLKSRILTMLEGMRETEELLILGDLIGGSPLTTMISALEEMGHLSNAVILGGMNLALALNAVLLKDQGIHQAKEMMLSEAHNSLKEFQCHQDEDDDI